MSANCITDYWRNGQRLAAISMLGALGLCLLFLAAAAHKILDPAAFALAVHRYQLLPPNLVNLTAIYLPWIELAAALALLSRAYRRPAAWILIVLLAGFTFGIAAGMARGLNIACGCFSSTPDAKAANGLSLLRNLLLIALAGIVIAGARRTRCQPVPTLPTPETRR